MIDSIPRAIADLIARHGNLGTLIGTFLYSSVLPIPSEAIIVGAGAIGVPFWSIVIYGALGATLGAMVGYSVGRYAGFPAIAKFGKYLFIEPQHIEKAEAFAEKYGVWGVLLGRLLPVIPYKIFSIAAGLLKIRFLPFVLWTLIGVIPRLILLSLFGVIVARYLKLAVIGGAVLAAGYGFFLLRKRHATQ